MYAVGGASSSDYVLPTTDDAAATSAIALREGHSHGDLMTAQATATLTDVGTNTVTLGLTRKTMLIQSVVVKKVPTAATAVSVTIAPFSVQPTKPPQFLEHYCRSFHFPGGHTPTAEEVRDWYVPLAEKMLTLYC